MDDVTLAKLENIKNCLARLAQKQPFTVEQLKIDFDLQDTVTVNIQRAIQSSVDLANHICVTKNARTPEDMADSFEVLRELTLIDDNLCISLKKAVGLRNVLVHEYSGIDWHIVFDVANNRMSVFTNFMKQVMKL